MVIVTRTYARSGKMSVSQELRDYFSELIQPLATNECLEQMSQKLKEEIVTKFEERFIEKNKKIDELEERILFQKNTINQLLIKFYGFMESNLKRNEKKNDVGQKVKECCESVQVLFAKKVSIMLIELEWNTRRKIQEKKQNPS